MYVCTLGYVNVHWTPPFFVDLVYYILHKMVHMVTQNGLTLWRNNNGLSQLIAKSTRICNNNNNKKN
jgi:hypothetical protein